MIVVGKDKLAAFCRKHADARPRFSRWLQVVESTLWRNFAEVRATFLNADLVRKGDVAFVVFNVGGNNYRVSTIIQYQAGVVYIDRPMTHDEYSRWSQG